MSKKVAVLFSGGLDSTYLVWKNLKDGNEVFPIYIEIENNEIKSILEKNRVKLLCKEFSKEFDAKKDIFERKQINDVEFALNVSVKANESSLYFKQVPIWLFGLVFFQSLPVDEIQIGYVSNDDAISYLEDIQNIYKSYQTICEPMKPLVFPLTKKKKYDMAHELPKQYRDLIFSCEMATIVGSKDAEIIKYEACCDCVPCKHIIAEDYYGFGEYPEPYHKNIDYQHVRALHRKGYKVVDKDGKEYWSTNDMLSPNKAPYQLTLDFNSCGDEELKCMYDKIEKAEYNG